jgi:nicotinamidase-related amidase
VGADEGDRDDAGPGRAHEGGARGGARDLVASEHWISSGFANTDLDMQLKQHGVDHMVLMGMRANTCIESTLREGVELGYHTTVLRDAVAAFSPTELKASLDVNYPIYSHALLTAEQFATALDGSK